jgi:hypothetical protein
MDVMLRPGEDVMVNYARSQRADPHGPKLALTGASALSAGTVLLAAWTLPNSVLSPLFDIEAR